MWRWGVTCCSWTASRGARWERTCAWLRTASRPPSARFSSSTSTVSIHCKNTRSSLYFEILQRKDSCIHRLESTRGLEIPPFLRVFNGDGIFSTACWGRGWTTTPFHSITLCTRVSSPPPPPSLTRLVRCSYTCNLPYRPSILFSSRISITYLLPDQEITETFWMWMLYWLICLPAVYEKKELSVNVSTVYVIVRCHII